MKVLSGQQIREADQYTIKHEPVTGINLMERAAGKCSEWLIKNLRSSHNALKIFCGPGNNGGDGLAIARQSVSHFNHVEVYILRGYEKYSNDFLINEKRLQKEKAVIVKSIKSIKEFPSVKNGDCIIDAIFGTGLNKPVTGLAAQVIGRINKSTTTVVAVDVPSGLFTDASVHPDQSIVHADYTLTFECQKLAFMFPENYVYTGTVVVLPIGLDKKFIDTLSNKTYLTKDFIKPLLIQRKKGDHKGTYGHALLIAGGYGKMGAAVLASRACMRAGAGLLTAHIPQCGYEIMQSAFPEAMVETDKDKNYFTDEVKTTAYDAVGIGPGISTKAKTAKALKKLLQKGTKPLIIDADAINLLGENKSWLKLIPEQSILTPHPKEFERITKPVANSFERHELQISFAKKYNVYVILKGHNTCIACPNGSTYFNSTGNAGMGTAGSGDVLTGILTGLKAQGYSSLDTCLLGVYLHGLAGDIAVKQKSMYGLIASDIIEALPMAFSELISSL